MPYLYEKRKVEREVDVAFIKCTRCGFKCLEKEAQPGWMHFCELQLRGNPMAQMAAAIAGKEAPEPRLSSDVDNHLCPSCSPAARELLLPLVH